MCSGYSTFGEIYNGSFCFQLYRRNRLLRFLDLRDTLSERPHFRCCLSILVIVLVAGSCYCIKFRWLCSCLHIRLPCRAERPFIYYSTMYHVTMYHDVMQCDAMRYDTKLMMTCRFENTNCHDAAKWKIRRRKLSPS